MLIPRGTIVIQSINRVDDSARVSGMGPTATNIVLEVTGQLPADNWVLLGETTTDAQGRFQWTSPLLPPPQNRFY
ncbi:MAG: hydroxyisourate hydrolase, partial [Verrucomicrobia bacterium]|nr:hydroxyisourate hydrolase [Verrucomicrobiota bacterium]